MISESYAEFIRYLISHDSGNLFASLTIHWYSSGKLTLIFRSVLDEGRLIDKETLVFYKIFRGNLLDKATYPL